MIEQKIEKMRKESRAAHIQQIFSARRKQFQNQFPHLRAHIARQQPSYFHFLPRTLSNHARIDKLNTLASLYNSLHSMQEYLLLEQHAQCIQEFLLKLFDQIQYLLIAQKQWLDANLYLIILISRQLLELLSQQKNTEWFENKLVMMIQQYPCDRIKKYFKFSQQSAICL